MWLSPARRTKGQVIAAEQAELRQVSAACVMGSSITATAVDGKGREVV